MVESLSGRKQRHVYLEEARAGDHICYYSDLRKMKSHYPAWNISKRLDDIFVEIGASWAGRSAKKGAA